MARRTAKHVPAYIEWAKLWEGPVPVPAPAHRRGSPQWAGINYENKFGKYLRALFGAAVKHGPWIQFRENGKTMFCQPDFVLVPADTELPVFIFECKLTYTVSKASRKLKTLYKPCVEKIWKRPTILVQVCKYLSPRARKRQILTSVAEVIQLGKQQPRQPSPSHEPTLPTSTTPSAVRVHLWNWVP